MLAYFTQDTALPPLGLVSALGKANGVADSFRLQNLQEDENVEEMFDLGFGNGMNCLSGTNCSHSKLDDVSCLFAGKEQHWPSVRLNSSAPAAFLPENSHKDPQSAASWILSLLASCEGNEFSQTGRMPYNALDSVAKLKGPFAFVVYDAANHRVLAARDRTGQQELYWGVTAGGHLLFSSSIDALHACNPSATAFPAGSVFVSATRAKAAQPGKQGWTIDSRMAPGLLHSFVKSKYPPRAGRDTNQPTPSYKAVRAVPRINSQGCLCGSVYRVASEEKLADWGASY